MAMVLGLATLTLSPLNCCFAASATEPLKHTSNDFTSVAKHAIPAVVSIKVKEKQEKNSRRRGQFYGDLSERSWLEKFFDFPFEEQDQDPSDQFTGQGSGFIVSKDGYIVTNRHVVKHTNEIIVTLNDGRELPGKLVGEDSNADIAIIKIDADQLPYLHFGNSDQLEVGQWVVAIGTPLGLQASLSAGIVSAKGRNNLDLARVEDFIQTDAALNRGNSGGPLLNLEGDVVGINTAIASTVGGYMGIGFAIPSNIAKNSMQQLIDKGSVTRSYIGIALQQMNSELASAFGLNKPQGIVVAQVIKDSPAERSQIKVGDIILKYDDHPISTIGGFRTAIALMTPGNEVKLSLLRGGKPLEIAVTVAEDPSNNLEGREKPFKASGEPFHEKSLGISVENLTPQYVESLKLGDDKGVIVSSVTAGSMAQWAGLRKGTLIMEVNQKKIENIEQFEKAVQSTDSKPLLLLIKDKGVVKFLSLKL